MRLMSGSGPFSVMVHGVWQSLQTMSVTRYLPRSTGETRGAGIRASAGPARDCDAGSGSADAIARLTAPSAVIVTRGLIFIVVLLEVLRVATTVVTDESQPTRAHGERFLNDPYAIPKIPLRSSDAAERADFRGAGPVPGIRSL